MRLQNGQMSPFAVSVQFKPQILCPSVPYTVSAVWQHTEMHTPVQWQGGIHCEVKQICVQGEILLYDLYKSVTKLGLAVLHHRGIMCKITWLTSYSNTGFVRFVLHLDLSDQLYQGEDIKQITTYIVFIIVICFDIEVWSVMTS